MKRNYMISLVGIISTVILSGLIFPACSSSTTSNTTDTPSTGVGGTVVRSDCIINGEIKNISKQMTGYPWKLDVLINSSDNVDDLPNPTIDKVGKVVTMVTDVDLTTFKELQTITAHVKYAGDVPQPGISLFIYDIKSLSNPEEVSLDQEFTLSIGQTALVQAENLTIKFVDIISDSRCPQDVTCIWAGEVNCSVEITKEDHPYEMILSQPGLSDQRATQVFGGYNMMYHIEPYPKTGTQIASDEYRLIMTVEKDIQTEIKINPAPIDDVKIAVTLSEPKEIIVYIKGGLRDTCTTFSDMSTERNGNTININVNVQTTVGQICGYIYTFFEKYINLGNDFIPGEVYTVKVNDNMTTFTMP
jgi:hypothetical protein